jgi:hypothetical protein
MAASAPIHDSQAGEVSQRAAPAASRSEPPKYTPSAADFQLGISGRSSSKSGVTSQAAPRGHSSHL